MTADTPPPSTTPAATESVVVQLSRVQRQHVERTMLTGAYDHSRTCATDTNSPCDCWIRGLRDLLDLTASCSCGSCSLYAEDPPRLGPHHYASCSRFRSPLDDVLASVRAKFLTERDTTVLSGETP